MLGNRVVYGKVPGSASGRCFSCRLGGLSHCIDFVEVRRTITLVRGERGAIVSRPLITFAFSSNFVRYRSVVTPILRRFKIGTTFFVGPGFTGKSSICVRGFAGGVILAPNGAPVQ